MKYEEFVASRCKPGQDILDSLTPEKCHLWHMATGVGSDAGELVDAIKKYVIYGKDLDAENLKEECGDVLFFITGVCNEMGWDLDEIMAANQQKLEKRYPTTYSDKDAIERKDKKQ